MSNELWAVHAQGPDEIYPAFDRPDAERHAAELNAIPTPPGILVAAVVIPSPWPASQHWQYLAEQEREHKQELLANVAPTDSNLSAMRKSGLSIDGDESPSLPTAGSAELPEPDFTLDGGDQPCYYAETVQRIVAALSAHQSAHVSLPRELLADLVSQDHDTRVQAERRLYALLNGGEA